MHLSCFIILKIFHIYYLLTGSNPVVGSSNNNTYEFPINAIAKHNFLFPPPLKYLPY